MEPVIELTSAFLASVDRDSDTQYKYGPDYYNDPRAQTLARIIENDLGVHQVRVLGGGAYGVAAATAEAGGDVIKLTADATEVESGTVLVNTPVDKYPGNVVHVQGAWLVRRLRVLAESWFDPKTETSHYARKRIGLLRMERVQALDRWEDATTISGLSEYVRFVKNKYKTWPHLTRKVSRAEARERYLRAGTELERLFMQIWKDTRDQAARDVARAIGQLRALGVYGVDFHGGNIGWAPAPPSPQLTLPGVENPVVEETMVYRDMRFDLITTTGEPAWPGAAPLTSYRIRTVNDRVFGPFGDRDQAIQFAHDRIDKMIGSAPGSAPESPAHPQESRVYKVFDIGESSVGMGAPKPKEVGKVRDKIDEKAYESPILARSVKVAELG